MGEAEKRAHRCCFTGHRPEKLHSSESLVKAALAREIWTAYQAGFRTFLTGMARGVDVWAGELVLRLRSSHQDVHLICALPHPDFEKGGTRNGRKGIMRFGSRPTMKLPFAKLLAGAPISVEMNGLSIIPRG